MPKGKGTGEGTDILEELESGNGEGAGGSAQAEVAVRGKGKTVGDALKRAGLKDDAKDLKGKFNDHLKNPKNKILATRIFPKQARGADGKMRDCADVVDMPPPMTLEEITRHLQEEYGGKKWNVRVQDEDGEVLDAKNIDVPGEVKFVVKPEDEFALTGTDIDNLGGPEGGNGAAEEPLDREIVTKEKEGKALLLEQQNARLRAQIADLTNAQKKPEVDVQKVVADALAAQEAKHRAELAERDKRQEMSDMERRINDSVKVQMDAMRQSLDKLATNPAQSTGMTELAHKIELIQTSLDNKIDKALGSYREMTNQQINALEKGVDGKLSSIQASLTALQHQKPDSTMKDVIPLITSSIERSTSGYKEMVGPVIKMLTDKQEADATPPSSPLEDTLETLGKFNLLGDRKGGDFGSRVVDFAEKMGPEVFAFIRDERNKGREVTEQTLKNHLKLQAEKISKEVSAAAAQEIKKIRAERDAARGLPAPAATTKSHQGNVGPSPVGNMSPEEIAARQRKESAPAPAPAPAASAPAPAPAPAPSSPAAAPRVQRPEPEQEEEQEEEEEEEEMTVEEEMAARVNSTLALLEREMKIRPRNLTWPNAAWDDLPAEVLDAIIFANDEEDVYKAIEPHADKELSERIWSMVRSDPAKKEFIVSGINIIKGWAVELQQKQRDAAGGAPPAEAPPQG